MSRLDDLGRSTVQRFGAAGEPGGTGESTKGRLVTEILTLLDEFLVPHGWVGGVIHRVHGVHVTTAKDSLQAILCNVTFATLCLHARSGRRPGPARALLTVASLETWWMVTAAPSLRRRRQSGRWALSAVATSEMPIRAQSAHLVATSPQAL